LVSPLTWRKRQGITRARIRAPGRERSSLYSLNIENSLILNARAYTCRTPERVLRFGGCGRPPKVGSRKVAGGEGEGGGLLRRGKVGWGRKRSQGPCKKSRSPLLGRGVKVGGRGRKVGRCGAPAGYLGGWWVARRVHCHTQAACNSTGEGEAEGGEVRSTGKLFGWLVCCTASALPYIYMPQHIANQQQQERRCGAPARCLGGRGFGEGPKLY